MAPFSRLQLAAALIEYDNDDSDPTKPRRSAHESAIFAHLRRMNPPGRSSAARRSTDYLGVSLPSEAGSVNGRESVVVNRDSVVDGRRSRASIDALRNPFGRDSTYEGIVDEEENELEVDLTSWGLDALLPEDKDAKGARKKAKSDALPNPHPDPADRPATLRAELGRRGTPAGRTMSMGNFDSFGEGGAFLEARSAVTSLGNRRHSFGTPLDLPAVKTPVERRPHRGRTASSHALIENIPPTPPLHSIPFPTSESVRSISPLPTEGASLIRPSSRASENVLNNTHTRTYSTASLGSQMLLNEKEPNPFAVRPPSPDRASRFDPKARARTTSYGSMGTMLSPEIGEESNPFALRPPSPSRSSRFDPKVRARTMSNGSLGTQMLLDNDAAASFVDEPSGRPRRYSRLELMRPKVLIMPSPLQAATPAARPSTHLRASEGFQLNADGPPLPPGARTAARSSTTLSMLETSPGLVASNSFTPNPRASLTLSQLTFRNNLPVDGQRDPAYVDIESGLRRATEDGEQILPEPEPQPELESAAPPVSPTPPIIVTDPADRSKRPAGKLYGKSLIDVIETRKAAMRSKQRVFTGDERPTMMARTPMARSSTLIDPESLKHRPISQRMDTSVSQPALSRRNSANAKTLLDFDDEIPGARQSQHIGGLSGLSPGTKKSVFGVDTLWERELAKLREMEERERQDAVEEAKRNAEEDARPDKKSKGKGKKGKRKNRPEESETASTVPPSTLDPTTVLEPRAASPPHLLPNIERATARRRPPPPADGDESDGDSGSDIPVVNNRQTLAKEFEAEEWVAGSSDEEERGRRRSLSAGTRLVGGPTAPTIPNILQHEDESSEEDLPLVATIGRAARRMTTMRLRDDDESDEDKPLTAVLDKTKLKLPSVGGLGDSLSPDGTGRGDQDDEDDKPLGLRVSRIMNSSQALSSVSQEADDDKPLALHPEQLRRTQYMMAQQQQQQLMMQQAAYHQSMIFGTPSMMASGFFAPPIAPPIMMPQQLPTTPPEASKFGRVDKWRHDVAVEGDQ